MSTKKRILSPILASMYFGWVGPAAADVVTDWNALAATCISTHRPGPPGLLDLAIVQSTVHDAVQAIEGRYQPYLAVPAANGNESPASAAAAAAYHVLSSICPNSAATLNAAYAPYLAGGDPGLDVGAAAAATLLAQRRGTPALPPNVGGVEIGQWRPTPPGNVAGQFEFLREIVPFTLNRPTQFRPEPPPPLTSGTYLRDYDEVMQFRAVASHPATPACPAPEATEVARFWSGNFVTQWNAALRGIAISAQLPIGDSARLFALATLAAADSAIAVWESKFHYLFWRPITAIREGDNDPNPNTAGETGWTPFIQSAHFPAGSQTPPYPDYTSGANGLTGAFTGVLQLFFGTDEFQFSVPGATPPSVTLCTNPRQFIRFSDAAQEVVDARIWLGIHFRFADDEARTLGNRVAHWTFMKFLRPVPGG
jgi:hypothetical protein